MKSSSAPLLEMRNISKDFYGNQVLADINFALKPGEILGLVGENGAGKTTLMKILFGMEEIHQTGGYGGEVFLDGKVVHYTTPFDALADGIGMVHQEFSLLPDFSASENILLNREPKNHTLVSEVFGDRLDRIDRKEMRQRSQRAIAKLGVELDPEMVVSEMPVGYKQFTEIARELSKDEIMLLVLDEPTAVLTEREAEILLSAMRNLAEEGIAIIFISHRLQEVIDVCDTVMVMRDGVIIKNVPSTNLTLHEVAKWMVGREVAQKAIDRNFSYQDRPVILSIKNLWVDMPGETVKNVSLEIYQGEILGIGGLAGQGKLGIPNGAMGLFPAGGEITFEGEGIPLNQPRQFLNAGMAFVSEDRRGVGLLLDEPLDWNIAFTAMQIQDKYLKKLLGGLIGWRNEKEIEGVALKYIEALDIKCTGTKQITKELSGGNQQKVCLAKAFAVEPKLLFVSEPTRGIDIGAKSLVLEALRHYNEEMGVTIVMISSELEELRSVCDRVAIIADGKVAGILPPEADAADFGMLMVGRSPLEVERRSSHEQNS